jgi:hypothetical protein
MRLHVKTPCVHPAAILLPAFIVWLSSLAPAFATGPTVAFDLAYAVECREVPCGEPTNHPGEKLMEADLKVSVRIEQGDEQDLDDLTFEITSVDKRLRIVDFLPRTQVQNSSTESVEVVKTTENVQSLGASTGTPLSYQRADAHGTLTLQPLPAGSAGATHRKAITETTKRVPPGKVVVTSGTVDNEHGVFFKLRASATTSLEGVKPLSFRFVAPQEWHGDWVLLSALARRKVKPHWVFKGGDECGQTKAFIALYEQGDAGAERAAQALAEAQELYFSIEENAQRRAATVAATAAAAEPRPTPPTHGPSRTAALKIGNLRFAFLATRDNSAKGDLRATAAEGPRVGLNHALGDLSRFSDGQHRRDE